MIYQIWNKQSQNHLGPLRFLRLPSWSRIASLALFLLLPLSVLGCSAKSSKEPVSCRGYYFDTVITITLYDSTDEAVLEDCMNLCDQYEKLFSATREGSDIYGLNQASRAAAQDQTSSTQGRTPSTQGSGNYVSRENFSYSLSSETASVLSTALSYSQATKGAFDPTIYPVSQLWGFSEDRPHVPEKDTLEKVLPLVDYRSLSISRKSSEINVYLKPGQELDLGGVAKGYIADELKTFLLSKGIHSAVINLGGNVLLIGGKQKAKENVSENFKIGLQFPFQQEGNTIAAVSAKDCSIVTSGCYERYFEEEDVLYHHILDPSTGYPVKNQLNAVTILSPSSVDGDCLSTACYVMGYKKASEYIESLDSIDAVFIFDDNSIKTTSGLQIDEGVITQTAP